MKIKIQNIAKVFRRKSKNQDSDSYYMASQWKLMGRKLKKHKLARLSMIVLGILYFQMLFGGFIAPQSVTQYDSKYTNCPPSKIHMFDSAGKFRGPFVYGLTSERDPETYKKKFVEVKEEIYKIKFFTKGAPYKLFGFIKMDIHLYGVDAPGGVFIFGTDNMGRDMFSKIVLGSQISLTIPFVGTIISLVLGVLIGGISGYFGGITDSIIQRGSEILMSFPSLPLWMALAAAIPSDIPIVKMYLYITIILSFLGWTGLARVVRSAFLASKEQDFIMAAKVAGVSDMKIITRHLVPGFLSYLIVNMTLGIPGMIVGETSMSFLGLGIRPPAVSWGVLLQDAREISNIAMHPWTLIPLLYVIVTVLAFNFFGDGLRDAADPYK